MFSLLLLLSGCIQTATATSLTRRLSVDVVSTLAGNNLPSLYDGVGTFANLNTPRGMAFSADESSFYFADGNNHAIRMYTMNTGNIVTVAGDGVAGYVDAVGTLARFNTPFGVAMHPTGTYIIITDRNNNRIRKVTTDTYTVSTIAGDGSATSVDGVGTLASIHYPVGIAVSSPQDFALICEFNGHKIRKLDVGSVLSTLAGSSTGYVDDVGTLARFSYPFGIALSPNADYALISDHNNHLIRHVYVANGSVSTYCGYTSTFGLSDGACDSQARFHHPRGIAISTNEDYVLACDGSNNVIRRIDFSSKSVAVYSGSASPGFADGALTAAQYYLLRDMSLAPSGNFVLVTTGPSRIARIALTASEAASTSAVTSLTSMQKYKDGAGTIATFDEPRQVSFSVDETYLLIADDGNHVIRKYYLSNGEVATLVGSSLSGYLDDIGTLARLNRPIDVQMHPSGEFALISDYGNKRVRCMNISTLEVSTFVGNGDASDIDDIGSSASIYHPSGIAFSTDGTFALVSSLFGHKIRKLIIATRQLVTLAGNSAGYVDGVGTNAQLNFPYYISMSDDYVLISDSGNHIIRQLTISSGEVSTYCGINSPGQSDGDCASVASFNNMRSIALSSDGSYMLIADESNNAIRKVREDIMQVATFSGGSSGYVDGELTSALYQGPSGLAISSDGAFAVVTELNGNRLRRIWLTDPPTASPTAVPTIQPTSIPSAPPTCIPSAYPTSPSTIPTGLPTAAPTSIPTSPSTASFTAQDTGEYTSEPSSIPSAAPSSAPSTCPTGKPSSVPTTAPSSIPSSNPTTLPTSIPTSTPTCIPSAYPTSPSSVPTGLPTAAPTSIPTSPSTASFTAQDTGEYTSEPSSIPSAAPSSAPSTCPTGKPSSVPTNAPSSIPSSIPTTLPTSIPTSTPTCIPSAYPTSPSSVPTGVPTAAPTSIPTVSPTALPSSIPSGKPTALPTSPQSGISTAEPSTAPIPPPPRDTMPTVQPTSIPTAEPTSIPTGKTTSAPTSIPTAEPTSIPTGKTTSVPTSIPTHEPTSIPTAEPSSVPTSIPTAEPTSIPTGNPTSAPTSIPTAEPTVFPTSKSTSVPTSIPTAEPSTAPRPPPPRDPMPTVQPTSIPTAEPTSIPTGKTTSAPTSIPTAEPTSIPTAEPSSVPTSIPTAEPTSFPTSQPTSVPSFIPASVPSAEPTSLPTSKPTAVRSALPAPSNAPSSRSTSFPTVRPSALPTSSATFSGDAVLSNAATIYGLPGAYFGASVSPIGDVNGDGMDDLLVGSPHSTGETKAAHVIFGRVGGSPDIYLTSFNHKLGFIIYGSSTSDALGYSASGVGDINGDAVDDFIISAPFTDNSKGAVYVIYGKIGYREDVYLSEFTARDGYKIFGNEINGRVGQGVAGVGDINGDGVGDMIISAPQASDNTGVTYLLYGRTDATYTDVDLSLWVEDLGVKFIGSMPKCLSGYAVTSAGDMNGDGMPDFIIGEPLAFSNYAGALRVVFGCANNCLNKSMHLAALCNRGISIVGSEFLSRIGAVMSAAGDINNDGCDDIIVAAPLLFGNRGAVYVIFGNTDLSDIDLGVLQPSQGYMIQGAESSNFGWSVAGGVDFNHDGTPDIIIGNPFSSDERKAVAVLGGRRFGSLSDMTTRDGFYMFTSGKDEAGKVVSAVGDFNGDGFVDYSVSASEDNTAGEIAGAVYIVYDIYNADASNLTHSPVVSPTLYPTLFPTCLPSSIPTSAPSGIPSAVPSIIPTSLPSPQPTHAPSKAPSITGYPTSSPTTMPSSHPTYKPTPAPSITPTYAPSVLPTLLPSAIPSSAPSESPSFAPNLSQRPTAPSPHPTPYPSGQPSSHSSQVPTTFPSSSPSEVPTILPTSWPTLVPTYPPSPMPSLSPTPHVTDKHGYEIITIGDCVNYIGSSANERLIFAVNDGCNMSVTALGGSHVYVFHAAPQAMITITDFALDSDKIDLSLFPTIRNWRDVNITRGSVLIHLPEDMTLILLHHTPADMARRHFVLRADVAMKSNSMLRVAFIVSLCIAVIVVVCCLNSKANNYYKSKEEQRKFLSVSPAVEMDDIECGHKHDAGVDLTMLTTHYVDTSVTLEHTRSLRTVKHDAMEVISVSENDDGDMSWGELSNSDPDDVDVSDDLST